MNTSMGYESFTKISVLAPLLNTHTFDVIKTKILRDKKGRIILFVLSELDIQLICGDRSSNNRKFSYINIKRNVN